jgi:hypothetical protein
VPSAFERVGHLRLRTSECPGCVGVSVRHVGVSVKHSQAIPAQAMSAQGSPQRRPPQPLSMSLSPMPAAPWPSFGALVQVEAAVDWIQTQLSLGLVRRVSVCLCVCLCVSVFDTNTCLCLCLPMCVFLSAIVCVCACPCLFLCLPTCWLCVRVTVRQSLVANLLSPLQPTHSFTLV